MLYLTFKLINIYQNVNYSFSTETKHVSSYLKYCASFLINLNIDQN